jgi:predicted nuclease of restriction endonuclease-like (RecB) superfamily
MEKFLPKEIQGDCYLDRPLPFHDNRPMAAPHINAIFLHLMQLEENQSYEKYPLNQTNFDRTVPEKYRYQAKLAVKDEYTFDFLELGDEHSERELEIKILNNIRKFLIEMGGYFTFFGNQYKLQVGTKEYFVDLILYHRKTSMSCGRRI